MRKRAGRAQSPKNSVSRMRSLRPRPCRGTIVGHVSLPSAARQSDDTVPAEPRTMVCPRCRKKWPEAQAPAVCPTDGMGLVRPRDLRRHRRRSDGRSHPRGSLHDPRQARRRLDGHRLSREAARDGPRGGDQDPPRRSRHRRLGQGALHARGAREQPARVAEHGHGLRFRSERERRVLSRDGAPRGREPRPAPHARRSPARAARRRRLSPGAPLARRGAREGDHPSRSEARQPLLRAGPHERHGVDHRRRRHARRTTRS